VLVAAADVHTTAVVDYITLLLLLLTGGLGVEVIPKKNHCATVAEIQLYEITYVKDHLPPPLLDEASMCPSKRFPGMHSNRHPLWTTARNAKPRYLSRRGCEGPLPQRNPWTVRELGQMTPSCS
jgi:hypothetical protein